MITELRATTIQTCKYSMGFTIFGLILITSRLMEVSREIEFFRSVEADWLGQFDQLAPDSTLTLRGDVNVFIGELSASRTILILSVIFLLVYILSWWWMMFALKQAKDDGSVPLRTVLLLSIFAAVDIAASAGFVLLRIIMFQIRDKQYPEDLRVPSLAEVEIYPAIAALRLATLKSSTATTDIVVSIVVGFLTGLRAYSVANIINFYKRSKKAIYADYSSADSYGERLDDLKPDHLDKAYATLPHKTAGLGQSSTLPYTSPPYMASPMNRAASLHSAAIRLHTAAPTSAERFGTGAGGVLERRSWAPQNTSSSLVNESPLTSHTTGLPGAGGAAGVLRNEGELQVQAADMPLDMQKAAMQSALQAIRLYGTEKHIAEAIKQDFDQLYSPTWHCIVGRNWGSCVTHSKKCYVRMLWKDNTTILLYRSI